MKHRDLVEICAIIASRLPREQFYAQNASDIVGYRLEAERVLRAVFEAVKEPTPEMVAAGNSALGDNGVDYVEDDDGLVCIRAGIIASPLSPEN